MNSARVGLQAGLIYIADAGHFVGILPILLLQNFVVDTSSLAPYRAAVQDTTKKRIGKKSNMMWLGSALAVLAVAQLAVAQDPTAPPTPCTTRRAVPAAVASVSPSRDIRRTAILIKAGNSTRMPIRHERDASRVF
jgi:hypothetical protein